MLDDKNEVVETMEKLEPSKSIVLDDGQVLHDVHKIEGTNIVVHKETEEEIQARRFGNADQVTWKTWSVVVVRTKEMSTTLIIDVPPGPSPQLCHLVLASSKFVFYPSRTSPSAW